jgi:hypothetical protein
MAADSCCLGGLVPAGLEDPADVGGHRGDRGVEPVPAGDRELDGFALARAGADTPVAAEG